MKLAYTYEDHHSAGAEHLYGDYVPTPEAFAINRARLAERMKEN